MAVPNCNSRNPFLDSSSLASPRARSAIHTELDLLAVARQGVVLVADVTKYLSTLPHPIETVEELVAVCAVTSALLTSLHAAIEQYPDLGLSRSRSFVALLCHDVLFAFRLLCSKVEEARRARVFEPNSAGLVTLPRVAWTMVLGSDLKLAALRSRLYVEKYRVRVLLEAVSWAGLKSMNSRTEKQEGELNDLEKMLPLIVERLIGVQKDYAPRLRALNGSASPSPTAPIPQVTPETVKLEVKPAETKPIVNLNEKKDHISEKEPLNLANQKLNIHFNASTNSLASTSSSLSSTSTHIEDYIYETWLLRHNPQKRSPERSTTILGLPIHSSHTIAPAAYYVKPVSSCPSETHDLLRQCRGRLNECEHQKRFARAILSMHEDAQWEIQRLLEAREAASSGDNVKRVWNVVGFLERPRRNISSAESGKRAAWWRCRPKEPVEWALVIRGQTLDTRCRALPGKHEDPWSPAPMPRQVQMPVQMRMQMPPQAPAPAQRVVMPMQVQQAQQQVQRQKQMNSVLRHVESKKLMSPDEARRKMEEIVDDIFIMAG